MWSLMPLVESEGGERLRLLVGKKYTLGRQNADFVITDDKSISRIHATLEVTHPDANVSHPHKPPVLTVKDTSKFGTVVRDDKIVNAEHLIKNGDTVKFGTVNSIYSAVYEPYVVTTSCLDPAAKKQTKVLTTRLGGHVVSDWRRECQLLVMSNLSVTVKVICALVSLKPIVTVRYLEKLAEAIGAKQPLPSPDNFTPPLTESQLNPNEVSFKKDERRQTLFQGKIFIFLNPKQFKKLNVAVELAGGTPMLMEEGTDDNEDDILVQPNTCVMECKPDDVTNQFSQNAQDWMRHVINVLKKHGRREIPDCELGFAVLYCSTERYCNPKIEAAPSQSATVATQSLSQQVAPPSQSQTPGPSGDRLQPVARIKEEPVSQSRTPSTPPRANPITKYMTKKRPRDEGDSDEAEASRKETAKVPRIKEELDRAAQRPSRSRRSVSPKPEPSVPGTISPKSEPPQSRSPSPAPRSRRGRAQDTDPSPQPTPRRSPRSPSPTPAESPPRRGRKAQASNRSPSPVSPKPEPAEDLDDFDAFKPRSRRKRSPSPAPARASKAKAGSTQERAVSPVRRSQRARATSRSPSPAPESSAVQDDFDDFDAFKPRSRRKASQSPAPTSTSKTKASPSTASSGSSSRATFTTVKQMKNTPKRRKADDDGFGEPIQEPRRFVQEVVKTPRRPVEEEEEEPEEEEVRPRQPYKTPDGYLSAIKPIKDQIEPTEDNQPDASLPKDAGVVVSSVRLTVPRRQRQAVVAENNNTINGKAVKNFKKFKKVLSAGAEGLPRIIGGTDLRPHLNSSRKVDEWFAEERQQEEERLAEDRVAEEMFAWKPTKAKKPPARRR